MKDNTMKNTLILAIITIIAGLALGFVYELTKAPIAQVNENKKLAAWQQVFPDVDVADFEQQEVNADIDKVLADMGINGSVNEVCKAGDSGYVVTATDKEGYGGDIKVTVGIGADGSISGISILSISETAGLGMRAQTDPSFIAQYVGKTTDHFYVSKDGGEGEPIDALSGATITSRAFTGAVDAALAYYTTELGGSGNE